MDKLKVFIKKENGYLMSQSDDKDGYKKNNINKQIEASTTIPRGSTL